MTNPKVKQKMRNIFFLFISILFISNLNAQYPCYDFNKRYDRFFKLGIGKQILPVEDVDAKVGTTIVLEYEIPKYSIGVQSFTRTGQNYVRFYADNIPLSADLRAYLLKNQSPHFQYGTYFQLNSTGMWVDGFVAGGKVRFKHETQNVGFFFDASVPVFAQHRRLTGPSTFQVYNSWFDTRIDPLLRNRSTEYRITLGTYLKINYF